MHPVCVVHVSRMCRSCSIIDYVKRRVDILRQHGKPSWGKILSEGGTLFLPVQIKGHWVVVVLWGMSKSFDEAYVQVYDSYKPTRQYGAALARCVCKITYFMGGFKKGFRFVDKTKVSILPLEQNANHMQCGVHVVARAFQLSHGFRHLKFSESTINMVRKWCIHTILSRNSEVCGAYSEWEKQNNCLLCGDVDEDRTVARENIVNVF